MNTWMYWTSELFLWITCLKCLKWTQQTILFDVAYLFSTVLFKSLDLTSFVFGHPHTSWHNSPPSAAGLFFPHSTTPLWFSFFEIAGCCNLQTSDFSEWAECTSGLYMQDYGSDIYTILIMCSLDKAKGWVCKLCLLLWARRESVKTCTILFLFSIRATLWPSLLDNVE